MICLSIRCSYIIGRDHNSVNKEKSMHWMGSVLIEPYASWIMRLASA